MKRPVTPKSPDAATGDDGFLREVLEKTRTRLLDTTRRNRLLNYKETSRDIAIVDEMPDQVFERLVNDGGSFRFKAKTESAIEGAVALVAYDDRSLPRSVSSGEVVDERYIDGHLQTPFPERDLERRLDKLFREHRTLLEETGANSLYLAIGFLEWADTATSEMFHRAPLILVPVRLDRKRAAGIDAYFLVPDEQALDTNYSLAEKLKEFNLALPLLDRAGADEEGGEPFTPESYWQRVDSAIGRMRQQGWRIVREMAIGLFRFSKQVMWHDLDPSRWPDHALLTDKPMVRRILIGPGEDDRPPGLLTEEHSPDRANGRPELMLIRDADSSQYSALVDALAREDGLVIEGPPGTGKSQTITNLIGAALHEGKTVLFVAEKMAALKVVFRRLEAAGLDKFCLQLHGLTTRKKELLADIERRLRHQAAKPEAIAAQRHAQESARQELIEFSRALSRRVGPENLPLHEVVWRVERLRHELPENYQSVDIDGADAMRLEPFQRACNLLNDLGREWVSITKETRVAWAGFLPKRYADSNRVDLLAALRTGIDAATDALKWFQQHGLLDMVPGIADVNRLLKLAIIDEESLLPPLRAGADPALVHTILDSGLVDNFVAVMEQIDAYLAAVTQVNEVFDYASEQSNSRAKTIRQCLDGVIHVTCDATTTVSGLTTERQRFDALIGDLEQLRERARAITELTGAQALRLGDYLGLAARAAALAEGPSDLSLHGRAEHAKAVAGNYLAEAMRRAEELTARAKSLGEFRVDHPGDIADLRKAYECVRAYAGSWAPILSSAYRGAKRRVRGILAEPRRFSRKADFLDSVECFVSFCEASDAFATDSDLRTVLGGLFAGVSTEWPRLKALIEFGSKLRDELGTDVAQQILGRWDAHVEQMKAIERSLRSAVRTANEFAASHPFPESLWQRPVSEIAATLSLHRDRIGVAVDALSPEWCAQDATLLATLAAVDAHVKARLAEHQIQAHEAFDALLAGCWAGAATRVEPLRDVRAWLQDRLTNPGVDVKLLSWLVPSNEGPDLSRRAALLAELRRLQIAVEDETARLAALGDLQVDAWVGGRDSTLDSFAEKLRNCSETIDAVPLMQQWHFIEKEVNALGLQAFARQVATGQLVGDQCGAAFELAVYERILAGAIAADPRLKSFSHTRYESLRQRFAEVDRALLDLNAQIIAERLGKVPVPQGRAQGRVGSFTELGLLRHQFSLRKRHAPIRQLVRRAGNALQALKPCFLMSPLSVAQYLEPGAIHFDLVVMDEASQIRPEDALGAIARSRTCVIVGDPKQLPPTSFFDGGAGEAEESDDAIVTDNVESVLDVCLKQLPFRRLRWHYRSEHESLIQFSNERFYDGDLVVFPSPRRSAREYGVHAVFVENASYRKGGYNRGEAEVVVESIVTHFRRYPRVSLGVAAFNKRQAEEIELMLAKVRREDPAIDEVIAQHEAEEPLFIKNLENVQGDERDVIFISTTYGPEQPGARVAQRFGPVNSDLGWRRLNVIATRARQRVEVFTSMKPADVLAGDGARRGVREFRAYLEYAFTGRISEIGTPTGGGPDSEFEIAVAEHLRRLGYECDPQVGVSGFYIDLGVRHPDRPGEYLMGVECDGASYHSAKSVRDRDRLRQSILESKGWSIHRIWSTSWFLTRGAEIDRLKRALEERLSEDREFRAKEKEDVGEEPIIVRVGAAAGVGERTVTEAAESETLLRDALERFWQANIRERFGNRERSILSERMIGYLVGQRPITKEAWYKVIPLPLRESMEPGELEFLGDVVEIIGEVS